MEPPIDPATHPDTASLHAAVASMAERHIRDHLDQWCIFRPLWEGTPSEEPAPAIDGQHASA
jgi:hypothetical protein